MGVRGLTSHAEQHGLLRARPVIARGTLLVDAMSLFYKCMESTGDAIPDCDDIDTKLSWMLDTLLSAGITPVFVLDTPRLDNIKQDTIVQRKQTWLKGYLKVEGKAVRDGMMNFKASSSTRVIYGALAMKQCTATLRRYKDVVKLETLIGEADDHLLRMYRADTSCIGILSNDSDMMVAKGCSLLHLDTVEMTRGGQSMNLATMKLRETKVRGTTVSGALLCLQDILDSMQWAEKLSNNDKACILYDTTFLVGNDASHHLAERARLLQKLKLQHVSIGEVVRRLTDMGVRENHRLESLKVAAPLFRNSPDARLAIDRTRRMYSFNTSNRSIWESNLVSAEQLREGSYFISKNGLSYGTVLNTAPKNSPAGSIRVDRVSHGDIIDTTTSECFMMLQPPSASSFSQSERKVGDVVELAVPRLRMHGERGVVIAKDREDPLLNDVIWIANPSTEAILCHVAADAILTCGPTSFCPGNSQKQLLQSDETITCVGSNGVAMSVSMDRKRLGHIVGMKQCQDAASERLSPGSLICVMTSGMQIGFILDHQEEDGSVLCALFPLSASKRTLVYSSMLQSVEHLPTDTAWTVPKKEEVQMEGTEKVAGAGSRVELRHKGVSGSIIEMTKEGKALVLFDEGIDDEYVLEVKLSQLSLHRYHGISEATASWYVNAIAEGLLPPNALQCVVNGFNILASIYARPQDIEKGLPRHWLTMILNSALHILFGRRYSAYISPDSNFTKIEYSENEMLCGALCRCMKLVGIKKWTLVQPPALRLLQKSEAKRLRVLYSIVLHWDETLLFEGVPPEMKQYEFIILCSFYWVGTQAITGMKWDPITLQAILYSYIDLQMNPSQILIDPTDKIPYHIFTEYIHFSTVVWSIADCCQACGVTSALFIPEAKDMMLPRLFFTLYRQIEEGDSSPLPSSHMNAAAKQLYDYVVTEMMTLCDAPEFEVNEVAGGEDETPDVIAREVESPTPISLPIDAFENAILDQVHSQRVTVIQGETGCGKSSRVPLMLYKYYKSLGIKARIIVTQPRRIAAVALAKRVSTEISGHASCSTVGYAIGQDPHFSQDTEIIYVTIGWLFMKLSFNDDFFQTVSHLVLDEVHERSSDSDLLSSLIKHRMLHTSPELTPRLVIMSATVDFSLFLNYFQPLMDSAEQAEAICVTTRQHPITVYYLETMFHHPALASHRKSGRFNINSLYHLSAQLVQGRPRFDKDMEQLVCWLCTVLAQKHIASKSEDPMTILVFMSGLMAIESLHEKIQEYLKEFKTIAAAMEVLPLHSLLEDEDKDLVLEPAAEGKIRVILSTNIAETSVTLPGVTYVVDTGLEKQVGYNERAEMNFLEEKWVSKASASQRAGRCGRICPGNVFRLYSKSHFETKLEDFDEPELLRIPLESTILRLKSSYAQTKEKQKSSHTSNVPRPSELLLTTLQPPETETILDSYSNLVGVGAILSKPGEMESYDSKGDTGHLEYFDERSTMTTLGSFISSLPVSMSAGRMLAMGVIYKEAAYLHHLVVIAAMQSIDRLVIAPHPIYGKQRGMIPFISMMSKTTRVLYDFNGDSMSDSVILLNIFIALLEETATGGKASTHLASKYGINMKKLRQALHMILSIIRSLENALDFIVPSLKVLYDGIKIAQKNAVRSTDEEVKKIIAARDLLLVSDEDLWSLRLLLTISHPNRLLYGEATLQQKERPEGWMKSVTNMKDTSVVFCEPEHHVPTDLIGFNDFLSKQFPSLDVTMASICQEKQKSPKGCFKAAIPFKKDQHQMESVVSVEDRELFAVCQYSPDRRAFERCFQKDKLEYTNDKEKSLKFTFRRTKKSKPKVRWEMFSMPGSKVSIQDDSVVDTLYVEDRDASHDACEDLFEFSFEDKSTQLLIGLCMGVQANGRQAKGVRASCCSLFPPGSVRTNIVALCGLLWGGPSMQTELLTDPETGCVAEMHVLGTELEVEPQLPMQTYHDCEHFYKTMEHALTLPFVSKQFSIELEW